MLCYDDSEKPYEGIMNKINEKGQKGYCPWVGENKLLMEYHDEEWGVRVQDDKKHFEMLILEGAQAGLNWLTILKKRDRYRNLFKKFDPHKVAKMRDDELEKCLNDEGIIRNRLKVYSVRKNAKVFVAIQKEFGSFDEYIWQFVNGKQIAHSFQTINNVPSQTSESIQISKDLKKRGMTFVGPTIIYAYMQATGLVNDHLVNCWRYHICSQHKR